MYCEVHVSPPLVSAMLRMLRSLFALALSDLAQTMEVDANTQKKIAHETRFLNQQFDKKNKLEN